MPRKSKKQTDEATKNPIKYQEVPKLNENFDASDYKIDLNRKGRCRMSVLRISSYIKE